MLLIMYSIKFTKVHAINEGQIVREISRTQYSRTEAHERHISRLRSNALK